MFALCLLLLLTACSSEQTTTPQVITVVMTRPPLEVTQVVTRQVEVPVTITPSPHFVPKPDSPKQLTVCQITEPKSLYWYDNPPFGPLALAKENVSHALYENLYTTRAYAFQPQGLVSLPSLETGDAEIIEVTVNRCDTVMDSQGRLVTIANGTRLRNFAGEELIFSGEPVILPQMVVRFTFQPLVWSDGQPVTAQDSVFSYKVARDPSTPGSKTQTGRTASYMAVAERMVEWRGVAGWLDPLYFTNVWMPLPAHQLAGLAAAELLTTPQTTHFPLSSGPFVVQEWVQGHHIALARNPYYYRQNEGLPRLDGLTIRFVTNQDQLIALLLAGECHIATQDGLSLAQATLLHNAQSQGFLTVYSQTTAVFEHLDFGINSEPVYASKRPDWFEDSRVRQAISQCLDRQAMAEVILYGTGQVSDLFVPPDHPLITADVPHWPFDPAAANILLDELGYHDFNGDGIRQNPLDNKPFRVNLGISRNNATHQQLATMLVTNLAQCGIEVNIIIYGASEWFAPGGPLFGRRFDLAIFPWITPLSTPCHFYTTTAIPGEANDWQGNNEMGWSNTAFDTACQNAHQAFWGSDSFAAATQNTFRLFAQELPSLPLFHYLKLSATLPTVQHFQPDPTQSSEFWNVFEWDIQE